MGHLGADDGASVQGSSDINMTSLLVSVTARRTAPVFDLEVLAFLVVVVVEEGSFLGGRVRRVGVFLGGGSLLSYPNSLVMVILTEGIKFSWDG